MGNDNDNIGGLQFMIKRKTLIALISSLILVVLIPIVYRFVVYPLSLYLSPSKAITEFYTRECAEDQIIHPLIISGKKVLPLLKKEIKNKKMDKRGYAILAIGRIGGKEDLNFLKEILYDESEECRIRYNALLAIFLIDIEYSKKLAEYFIDKNVKEITNLSKNILEFDKNNDKMSMLKSLLDLNRKMTLWSAIIDKRYY
jgi:hypothetical protein